MFENVSVLKKSEVRAKRAELREQGKLVRLWASREHVTKGAYEFAQKTGCHLRTIEELRRIEEGSATFSAGAWHRIMVEDLDPLPDEIEVQIAEDQHFGWDAHITEQAA